MPNAPIRDIITYYEEAGSGPPLVLIMGMGGDLQGWALQVPELSKHFRVIRFDNRGAGRTSSPDKPYSIAGMADDLAALLDHLGIARAHILGFSMGGCIAQEFALKYPARVDKLILLATTAHIDGYSTNIVKSMVNVRRSNMSREQTQRLTATFMFTAGLVNDSARFEAGIQNGLNNPYAQQDHAFLRQAQAVLEFDARERVKGIKAPTLVVAGTDDILIPARNGKTLATAIGGAKLVELPGGHGGCIEFASEYNAAFLEFLGAR
jgi:pimeloyl-ACP methyl ester carboxylesterase